MSKTEIVQRQARITRAADSDERTIEALLVPFNQPVEIFEGYREQFAPGSVRTDETPPLLFRDHDKPIGTLETIEDRADGVHITARISATALGDETWQLIKDGVLTRMSIGFIMLGDQIDEQDSSLHTITDAIIREASVVPFPAYPQAKITSHRNEENKEKTMTVEFMTRAAGDELAARLSEQDRKLEALAAEQADPAPAEVMNIRSFGEYAYLYASGDQRARAAFDGFTSTTASTVERPEWLGMIQKDMTAKQPILNVFTHETNLPSKGLTLQYGRLAESTFAVERQAAEGDQLVHTGKLAYEAKNISVETIGGYTTVSRQTIERAGDVNVLNDIFLGMAKAYALHIEKRMRATVTAAATAAEASPTIKAAPTNAQGWLSAVLGLADAYEDSIYPLDGLLVSPATFETLAALPEERKALQISGAPENKIGTLTVSVPEADLYGLKVVRIPKWEGNHAVGFASSAAVCKESAGAPLRLSDSDVTKLTDAFSVYGYAAFYVPGPDAFKAIKLA